MAIAVGTFKKLTYKKQSGLGVIATGGAATGQALRRVSSTLDMKKATYASKEITPSMQRRDSRHGMKSVDGSISGELSVGTYQSFIESTLRQLAQTQATTTAIITVEAAVTSGASGTFTRSGGSYLTNGFKIGDVVRWSGWATTGVPNNAHNFIITALTALVMTGTMMDGVAIGAKIAGDTVTCVATGKKSWIPTSGHTRDYYTIEHDFSDIVQSEQFTDCMIGGCDIKLPASGMATVDFPILGLNMVSGTAAYFTSPTAASTGDILAAVNGAVYVAGVKVALITSLDISIKGNITAPGGVVGSDVDPDLFPGVIDVSGNISVLFQDATMRDYFVLETEVSIFAAFTTTSAANSPFMAVVMSNVKLGGASKNDGETGLTMTMPFTATENTDGGAAFANLMTTISIQDSQWV